MRIRTLGAALLALALAAPAHAKVVINEVDYDQPGTDTAEFIELLNVGPAPANLSTYTVELVNGSGGGAAIYQTIPLPAVTLPVGSTFVLCGNSANTYRCDLEISPHSDAIQNGAPDAIGLRNGGVLEDALSYEGSSGAPYTEGVGTTAADDNITPNLSIGRTHGVDSDNNNADFTTQPATPGSPSVLPVGGALTFALMGIGLALLGARRALRPRSR